MAKNNVSDVISNCCKYTTEIEGFESFKKDLKETVFQEQVEILKDNLKW